MTELVLCTSCSRHVRRAEERCPFCGTLIAAETRHARAPVAPAGLSRAKLYAFHAAVATGVATAACGGSTTTTSDSGSPVDAQSSGALADTGQGTLETNDAGAQDDVLAESSVVAEASSGGAAGDGATVDTGSEHDGWGPPPPPYGCVFPEGCGDVKV
jgi:hypothetical protein